MTGTTEDRETLARLHADAAARARRHPDPHGSRVTAGLFEEMRAIRRRLEREIARERGWIVAKTAFSIEQLLEGRPAPRWNSLGWTGIPGAIDGRVIDHSTYFRHAGRPYRPAAILTHSYAGADEVSGFASGLGLAVEFLPWSWYYPEACTAALLTSATGVHS